MKKLFSFQLSTSKGIKNYFLNSINESQATQTLYNYLEGDYYEILNLDIVSENCELENVY